MDPARFPWPPPVEPRDTAPNTRATLFMAAVTGEFIKGGHIAHEACRILREARSDFELVVTSDPPGRIDEFIAPSAGARKTTCPAATSRPTFASCQPSRKTA